MKYIESLHNPFIKNLFKLQEKSRERKKQGLFIIEGKREIELALNGNYKLVSVLFVSSQINDEYLSKFSEIELIEISQEIYKELAYRESTEGILAVAKTKNLSLNGLKFSKKNLLILVVEGIEKPGNIGAMLRTSDATNIDAFIIANPKTDVYNPNVIRSSVGCLFTNKVAVGNSEEIIKFLKNNNITIFATTLQNSNEYTEEDFKRSSAFIVGTEATGLTEIWRREATQNINIPMEGVIDSMNVSVVAAILLFEAKRQRKQYI